MVKFEKEYISKKELMKRTGKSQATIQRRMREGLPFVRYYGNVVRFCWQDVKDWLNAHGDAPPSVMK